MKEVLTYFISHPQAADDLEGVARWRLLQAAIRARVDETHTALEWLVGRGFLRGTRTAGSSTVFSLNADAVDEIQAFLDLKATAPDEER